MNDKERLDLKKLMTANDYVDNTEGIRKLKHSHLISSEIIRMKLLKEENFSMDEDQLMLLCKRKCSFLYNTYTDIFNRMFKGELDMELMQKALVYLRKIEDGEIDQQEGSVMMGKLLHKVFVSSGLKRIKNLEKEHDDEQPETFNEGISISYKEFKRKHP